MTPERLLVIKGLVETFEINHYNSIEYPSSIDKLLVTNVVNLLTSRALHKVMFGGGYTMLSLQEVIERLSFLKKAAKKMKITPEELIDFLSQEKIPKNL